MIDCIGIDHGFLELLANHLVKDTVSLMPAKNIEPARIDEAKVFAAPITHCSDAIAGDSRLLVNDGDAPVHDAIEQGGLTDVRAADDHNFGEAVFGHRSGLGGGVSGRK